ncbi:craniofacial development protein 2-like [Mytilus edulis]|uniref:craniofacial development protein 2-like n=1 Tax=Mytilus edulis TaxID=6550 RepID=UPI0039EE7494
MGPNGIGEMNENSEIFVDFCAVNSLVIGGTLFPHKNCHKVTWVSPNGVTENQIDHIAISRRWRSSLQDVRNKRGADIASYHHLIIAKIRLKLLSTTKTKSRRKKFNVDLFKDLKVVQDYQILLQNEFSVLENLHDDETSINTAWEMTRDSIVQSSDETVGYLQQNRKQWMSENTWKIVNERLQVKEKVLTAITRQQKKQTQEQYSNKDKEVKETCKQDKRNFVELLAREAEAVCSKGDIKPYSTLQSNTILSRMKNEVDKLLRDEQAGFRQERSCIDQIATLRIIIMIIEQAIEWQTTLRNSKKDHQNDKTALRPIFLSSVEL